MTCRFDRDPARRATTFTKYLRNVQSATATVHQLANKIETSYPYGDPSDIKSYAILALFNLVEAHCL